jgi:hypothetical protein
MKINKKYIYPLIGVAIAVGVVLLATKKKPNDGGGETPEPTPEDNGDISPEQKKIDATLNTILANKNANALIKGKKIYSKVATAKGRTQPAVNDGVINNLYGTISNANTYLGNAVGVATDLGKTINSATKKSFVWVKVQLSKEGYEAVQSNRSIFTRDLFTPATLPYVYFREDVIKL